MEIITIATGSSGNLYILKTNKNYYLIECGIKKTDIIRELYKKGLMISQFKGCFVSHCHNDHCCSIDYVNKYMPIYSNDEVFEKNNCDGMILKANKKYEFDDLVVIPFYVNHGNAINFAYIFSADDKKILFATDFSNFDVNLKKIMFNELYIECNWTRNILERIIELNDEESKSKYERQFNTHCSVEVLATILDEAINLQKCSHIHLIHPSKEVCDREYALKYLAVRNKKVRISFVK